MILAARAPTLKIYFEYWPVIWLWPISLVLMQLTLLHLPGFELTVSVVICHRRMYLLMLYWVNRPSDQQVVVALAVIVYSLLLGLLA